MASLQIMSSNLCPFNRRISGSKKIKISRVFYCTSFKVYSKLKQDDNDDQNKGEEPPESLFMKELKRRGMNSLLEESNKSTFGDEEMKFKEEGGYSKRNAVSTDYEKSLSNQRERSMALNSEGLEGLFPRAKVLVSTGATFFLGFGPLILITVAIFGALYLYFGPAFIHDASTRQVTLPPYIDPYVLLEDERISQMASRVK